jgi:hypothetical protein
MIEDDFTVRWNCQVEEGYSPSENTSTSQVEAGNTSASAIKAETDEHLDTRLRFLLRLRGRATAKMVFSFLFFWGFVALGLMEAKLYLFAIIVFVWLFFKALSKRIDLTADLKEICLNFEPMPGRPLGPKLERVRQRYISRGRRKAEPFRLAAVART